MHDLLIHELGARHVRWCYDDPSGVPDASTTARRIVGERVPLPREARLRMRLTTTPKPV